MTIRLATFNVENLFRRPLALQPDRDDTRVLLETHQRFNTTIAKARYTAQDKTFLLGVLETYGMADRRLSADDPFELVEVREKLFVAASRDKPARIVAEGRADWDGWLDLRKVNVHHVAIDNTARVIAAVAADVLAVVEAEDRIALQRFNDLQLRNAGFAYLHNMLIDGNDARGIDVGLYSRHPIDRMRSHIGRGLPAERVFSRDCAEFEIVLPSGASLWVLVNHFKSKGYGDPRTSNARRRLQAEAVRDIYAQRRASEALVAVVGDLNDTPDSAPLAPLLRGSDLRDAMDHPAYLRRPDARPGTYATGTAGNKIDYVLLSPALWDRVTDVDVERRGIWAPRTFKDRFSEVTSRVTAASDHAAVWVDLDL